MATYTETSKNSPVEAAQAMQDAVRRYMDESAALGRTYFSSWSSAAQSGMRTAFELQNAAMQNSRVMLDSAVQANRSWLDQAADAMRKGQAATASLVSAGWTLVESSIPNVRF